MNNTIKLFLFAALFALALIPAHAGVQFAFDAPVDCTHYVAGGGSAVKYEIRSINYDTGEVRFQLVDSAGHYLGNGSVFGIVMTAVDQATVKAAIVVEIQSKT